MSEQGRSSISDENVVYKIIDNIGRIVSLLIFVLIAILLYGVIMRYIFNLPSVWVSELSGMIYACYFLISGSYALMYNEHVRVNIFRSRFSPRTQAAVDLLTWILFYLFIGVIFWLGIKYAYASVIRMERASTVWAPYIWPVKLLLRLSALLMLVAGLLKTIADLRLIFNRS